MPRCKRSAHALLRIMLLLSAGGCVTSPPPALPPPPVVVDCPKLPPLPPAASESIPSGFYSRSEARTKRMLDWLTTWPADSPPAKPAVGPIGPESER